eukprot:SAG11_NODE_165_length_13834_cov_72.998544_8_plen_59_part_00
MIRKQNQEPPDVICRRLLQRQPPTQVEPSARSAEYVGDNASDTFGPTMFARAMTSSSE